MIYSIQYSLNIELLGSIALCFSIAGEQPQLGTVEKEVFRTEALSRSCLFNWHASGMDALVLRQQW